MIMIWGVPTDPSTSAVLDCLVRRNAPVFFLNHARIYETTVSMSTGRRVSFEVSCGGQSCALDDCSAAYLRPYDYRDYQPPDGGSGRHSNPALVHHLISAWAEFTPALVISRPSAEGSNHSKLYQAAQIRAAGFLTPETLVTNDVNAIRELAAKRGRLVYKSMSNVRSIVTELRLEELARKALGPVQFQERVEGQNIRVHVVGDECFACGIETDGTDYRYAQSSMFPLELPADVARQAIALTRRLGLILGGLDLILAAGGRWHCLEVNPSPAFASFIEADRVADAVARALLNGSRFPGEAPSTAKLLCF